MIRLFIAAGVVGVFLVGYLTTYGQGPEYQMSPSVSLLKKFEADGVVPGANDLTENEEVEHDIFDVPPEDEVQLRKVMSMGGMNMGGMQMEGDAADRTPMGDDGKRAMKMEGDAADRTPMGDDGKRAMKMEGDAAKPDDHAEDETPKHGEDPQSGLKITEDGAFDREINLTMAEWKFSDLSIDVKRGERIRFNITNDGKIPHEFMFMTMPAMQAVGYRTRRADWNLLEHEALFEKSLVLPGGRFSFIAEIKADGAWMFMCMLPYHMQLGMMGQMATPGRAMKMDM